MKKPIFCITEQVFLSLVLLVQKQAWDINLWRLWRQFWIAVVTDVAVRLTLQSIWNEPLLLIVFIGPEPGVLDSVGFINIWTSVMVKWDEAPKWNCSHCFSIHHFVPYFILVYYMAKWERKTDCLSTRVSCFERTSSNSWTQNLPALFWTKCHCTAVQACRSRNKWKKEHIE